MTPTPNALCFGSELPASGAACVASLSPNGLMLIFLPDRGEEAHIVPFSALAVGAGGFDHDQLVLKWTDRGRTFALHSRDPELIQALRAKAPAELTEALGHATAQVRWRRAIRRLAWVASVAVLVGGLTWLWVGSAMVVDLIVSRIPLSWEESLGESAYRQFLSGQTVVKEGPAVQAVQAMADRLTAHLVESPYRFQVTVVENHAINAFALPGGYIVVFSGLLKQANGPDEVAGVLGHEMNHVLLRHAMERIVKNMGLVAVITVLTGNQQGLAGVMKELGIELVTLKFGREQELEADLEGLRLLHRARVSPDGMITFFQRLAESEGRMVALLSTHPMSEARAERLRTAAATLPRMTPEPFGIDWQAVQGAVR